MKGARRAISTHYYAGPDLAPGLGLWTQHDMSITVPGLGTGEMSFPLGNHTEVLRDEEAQSFITYLQTIQEENNREERMYHTRMEKEREQTVKPQGGKIR